MARVSSVLWFLVLVAGCAPTSQQRARLYSDDALHQYELGNYRDARDSYEAALALQPDDVGLLYNAGNCQDRLGNDAKAEYYYVECLRRAPGHAICRHALAVLWVREGKGDEAVRMIEEWLAAQPKLAAAYAEDGWLRHQLGDLRGAQARLQQALQLEPQNQRALVEMGLVYEELSRPDLAAVLYERTLHTDPNQADIANRLNAIRATGIERPRPQ